MAISLVTNGVASPPLSFGDIALEGDDIDTISDEEIRLRLARHHDQPEDRYDGYVIDRWPNDEDGITFVVRKKATHGESDEDDLADKFAAIFGEPDETEIGETSVSIAVIAILLKATMQRVNELSDHFNKTEVRLAWLEGAAGKK